jgi:hypothetical protein
MGYEPLYDVEVFHAREFVRLSVCLPGRGPQNICGQQQNIVEPIYNKVRYSCYYKAKTRAIR